MDGKRKRCPRKRSDMTPCVIEDGDFCYSDDGVCVGCNVAKDKIEADFDAHERISAA